MFFTFYWKSRKIINFCLHKHQQLVYKILKFISSPENNEFLQKSFFEDVSINTVECSILYMGCCSVSTREFSFVKRKRLFGIEFPNADRQGKLYSLE